MSQPLSEATAATAPMFLAIGRHGLEARLRVTPRARCERIEGVIADADGQRRLKVAVTEAADRGRANEAVIALLAREWGIPKSALAIVAGASDRRKTIVVAGNAPFLYKRLAGWCRGRGLV